MADLPPPHLPSQGSGDGTAQAHSVGTAHSLGAGGARTGSAQPPHRDAPQPVLACELLLPLNWGSWGSATSHCPAPGMGILTSLQVDGLCCGGLPDHLQGCRNINLNRPLQARLPPAGPGNFACHRAPGRFLVQFPSLNEFFLNRCSFFKSGLRSLASL